MEEEAKWSDKWIKAKDSKDPLFSLKSDEHVITMHFYYVFLCLPVLGTILIHIIKLLDVHFLYCIVLK